MSFVEVQFPVGISYGSRRGPTHSTGVVETTGGHEERVARWSASRMRFNARFGIRSESDLVTVDTFFRARQGRAQGFRYKDWFDYTSAADGTSAVDDEDQSIGTGTGTQTQFQLSKTYTSGATSRTRTITKPVSGTVVVAVDSVAKTEGVDFTVNTATGLVTFTVAPAVSTSITAGFQFDTPARFDIDDLEFEHDAFEAGSVPDIPIIELQGEGDNPEQPFPGGGTNWGSVSASFSLAVSDGLTHYVQPSTSGLDIILPDATTLVPGRYFVIKNDGSATITVQTPGSPPTDLVDMSVGDALEFLVFVENGTNTWESGQV